jgi:alpha-tubulin suppressor-like RCC1 family protein
LRQFRTIIRQQGYVLPATIVLGLATSIVSIGLLQATSISSQSLSNTSYQAIAQEAANAGVKTVQFCVQNNFISWTTLTPFTDCSGSSKSSVDPNTNLDVSTVTHDGNNWRSSYSVGAPAPPANNLLTALSIGTVKLYNSAGVVVQTYTAKAKITLPSIPNTEPISTGNSITDIKNQTADCAIANGLLYCWGDNSNGQLGRGYTGNGNDPVTGASIGKPQVVKGAIDGKTVTKISVAGVTVCAVADGTSYCWGDNTYRQLGSTSSGDTNIPKDHVPDDSASSDINGKNIVDIQTGSENNPAGILDIAADGKPHTCALIVDGSVTCWGANDFRQLTGKVGCGFFQTCYPDRSSPTFIDGYTGTSVDNGLPQKGKKAEKIGSGTHISCLGAEGSIICWGPPIPLPGICFFGFPAGPADHIYIFPVAPFFTPNSCTDNYSNGYTLAGDFSGKSAPANSWDMSMDEGCGMANTDFVCMGISYAFGGWVFPGFSAPATEIANANITSHDNGDNGGGNGIYCVVNSGVAQCAGSQNTGTTSSTQNVFLPLVATGTAGVGGLTGKIPMRIAAGSDHGCVVANGQLLCWGNGTNGVLADNNKTNHTTTNATVTGGGVIGTADSTYAAHDSISVGKDFACGIVNAQTFCWGSNANGKLGQGTLSIAGSIDNTIKHPQRVAGVSTFATTKVSAGTDHACAIASGKLYCWGDNSSGQLGIGTTVDNPTPQQVGHNASMTGIFDNKLITDVSAGDQNTCAIAAGQLYCWGDNGHRQLGNNDIFHTEKDSPILVNNDGVGHNIHTDMNVTAVTVGTDHVCAIVDADAYCWGNNANGKTGIGSSLFDSDPTLLNQGTAGTSVATGGDPGPNNTRPLVSAISAGTSSTCAIINSKVSCWGSNANGRTGQNTTSNLPTPTLVPTQIKGTAKDYYATAISVGDTHACAILDGNLSNTNGNVFCWGSGADGRLGDESQSLFAPTNITQVSNQAVNSPGNTISGSGSDNDNIGRSTTSISAGYNSTCDIANGTIQCWGLGASGQIGNDNTASQLLPKGTSAYAIAVYVKPKIY